MQHSRSSTHSDIAAIFQAAFYIAMVSLLQRKTVFPVRQKHDHKSINTNSFSKGVMNFLSSRRSDKERLVQRGCFMESIQGDSAGQVITQAPGTSAGRDAYGTYSERQVSSQPCCPCSNRPPPPLRGGYTASSRYSCHCFGVYGHWNRENVKKHSRGRAKAAS